MAPCADGTLCGFDTDARRVAQIHALLEADFVPLELCARLAPLLEALEGLNKPLSAASPVLDAALGQYKRALQQARPRPRPPSVVYEPGRGPVPDAALGQYKRALQQARPGRGARMRRARRAGGRLPGLVAGRAPCDATAPPSRAAQRPLQSRAETASATRGEPASAVHTGDGPVPVCLVASSSAHAQQQLLPVPLGCLPKLPQRTWLPADTQQGAC
jgi:hypothetical protein